MNIDLKEMTLIRWQKMARSGAAQAADLTASYLQEIGQRNSELNIYLEVFAEATEQAAAIDRRQAQGEILPLAGAPLALKDNILFENHLCSAGSKILSTYRAAYTATVLKRLLQAGAVILGRVNMDEFAMGSSTENSAFGPTKNPLDSSRVPGGSSGGSAAAVSANLALAALGSDTGGSVRQPASFCGVVGLKPTYGAVSRYGLIALASSFDQIGPLAKTVADVEIIFNVIKGRDPLDATSSDGTVPEVVGKEKVLGVPRSFFTDGVDEAVLKNFDRCLTIFKERGFQIIDVDLPHLPYALACYYIIMTAEASANLARFDGLRYGWRETGASLLADYLKTRGQGFGREVRRRILLGTYVLSSGYYDAYYRKAKAVRHLLKNDFAVAFQKVGAIVTPTTPTTAFKLGERTADPLQMYLADILTVGANLTGLPAISLPAGKDSNGLPFGLQITAPAFSEELLFKLGKEAEAYV